MGKYVVRFSATAVVEAVDEGWANTKVMEVLDEAFEEIDWYIEEIEEDV